MDVKELLDEESLDPKKLFDDKQYITLLVNREGFSKKQNDSADVVSSLLEKELSREEQEEIYARLKHAKAEKMIVEAIANSKRSEDKAKLIAACWESGLEMTDHFLFFARLVCDDNFSVAMEALTVVENMEGKPGEKELASALELAQDYKGKNTKLVEELVANIKQRIG